MLVWLLIDDCCASRIRLSCGEPNARLARHTSMHTSSRTQQFIVTHLLILPTLYVISNFMCTTCICIRFTVYVIAVVVCVMCRIEATMQMPTMHWIVYWITEVMLQGAWWLLHDAHDNGTTVVWDSRCLFILCILQMPGTILCWYDSMFVACLLLWNIINHHQWASIITVAYLLDQPTLRQAMNALHFGFARRHHPTASSSGCLLSISSVYGYKWDLAPRKDSLLMPVASETKKSLSSCSSDITLLRRPSCSKRTLACLPPLYKLIAVTCDTNGYIMMTAATEEKYSKKV